MQNYVIYLARTAVVLTKLSWKQIILPNTIEILKNAAREDEGNGNLLLYLPVHEYKFFSDIFEVANWKILKATGG